MRTITIKEVQAMSAGEIIPGIAGTVTGVFDRVTGTNGKGEWSVQSIMVKDATGEIKVKIWDREHIARGIKGTSVTLSSLQSSKGVTGLKAEDNEYQGRTTREIKMTGSAVMTAGTQGATTSEQTEPPDDIPYDAPAKQHALSQPTPSGTGKSATCRATELRYDETFNTGNYTSVKIGITVAINEGGTSAEALAKAKQFIAEHAPATAGNL